MKKKPDPTTPFPELRRLAEEKYEQKHPQANLPLGEVDLQRLFHELQVHQIELEMQNEELLQTRAEVEAWLGRYTDLYDFAPIGYFTLGRDGIISQVNTTGALMLGVERSRLVGRRFGLFIENNDSRLFNTFIERVFDSHVKQACELMLRKEGDQPRWVQLEANLGNDSQACRTVVMDIHARKQAEMTLEHLSLHDALTDLYNRSYFLESLDRYERGRHFPVSILIADVDHLKRINDHKGNGVGDSMLKRAAKVLTTAFRVEDGIARIGGDEFAVLLPHTNSEAAEVALDRLNDVLQEHNGSYFTEDPLQLSVGKATATEYGYPLKDTLKEAESDMIRRKQG